MIVVSVHQSDCRLITSNCDTECHGTQRMNPEAFPPLSLDLIRASPASQNFYLYNNMAFTSGTSLPRALQQQKATCKTKIFFFIFLLLCLCCKPKYFITVLCCVSFFFENYLKMDLLKVLFVYVVKLDENWMTVACIEQMCRWKMDISSNK